MAAEPELELARTTGDILETGDQIMLFSIEENARTHALANDASLEEGTAVARGITDRAPFAVIVAEDPEYADKLKQGVGHHLEATLENLNQQTRYLYLLKVYMVRTVAEAEELIDLNSTIGLAIVHQDLAIQFAERIRAKEATAKTHPAQTMVIIGVFQESDYQPEQLKNLTAVISNYRELLTTLKSDRLKKRMKPRLRFALNAALTMEKQKNKIKKRVEAWIDKHAITASTSTSVALATKGFDNADQSSNQSSSDGGGFAALIESQGTVARSTDTGASPSSIHSQPPTNIDSDSDSDSESASVDLGVRAKTG